MACPQAEDGGNELKLWSIAEAISNKQSRTTIKGWYSALRVERGAKYSSM
jgi:hypothetical protein